MPLSSGSGQGEVFINAKWMLNLNGLYQLPWDMEVAGNLYGKQGNPFRPSCPSHSVPTVRTTSWS